MKHHYDGLLNGKTIVFSGIEVVDKITPYIVKSGGIVRTQVSGVTDILVVKSLYIETAKLRAARNFGTHEIIVFDDFVKKYMPEFAGLRAAPGAGSKKNMTAAWSSVPKLYELPYKAGMSSGNSVSIRAAQKALGVPLKHGDIVNFEYNRSVMAHFVVVDKGKKHFVKNPDLGGSGYLTVPLVVTAGFPDALAMYKDFSEVEMIEIGGSDAFIKKLLGRSPSDYFKRKVRLFFIRDYEGREEGWKLDVQFVEGRYSRSFDMSSVTGPQILEFVTKMEEKRRADLEHKKRVGVPMMNVRERESRCVVM